jgi:hypothetical protein
MQEAVVHICYTVLSYLLRVYYMDTRNHFYLVLLQENPLLYCPGQTWVHILVSQTPTGGSKDVEREYTNAIQTFVLCSIDVLWTRRTTCNLVLL